jgi:anti-anti-sigma factor
VGAPGILVTEQDGASLLTFAGEYDLSSAAQLRRRIQREIDRGRPCVADLRGARFIDSTIVGVLLDAHRASTRQGAPFALVLPDPEVSSVRRMFELTSLLAVFDVHDDPDEAVTAVVLGPGRT